VDRRHRFYLIFCLLVISLIICLTGCKQSSPPLSKEAQEEIYNILKKSEPTRDTSSQKATQVRSLLQAAGVTAQGVYIEDVGEGKKTLLVVIDYSKLPINSSPGGFITTAVQALIKVAAVKSLDLSGLSYITVALRDSKARIIVEAGVPAGDADAFRKGQIKQSQFVKKIAIKVMDRFAGFEAMGKSSK
jgi:hypothetical protein